MHPKAMSQLLAFTNFLKDRQYAASDLDQFLEIVEPIADSEGRQGYRLKPLQQTDRITQRCKVLIHYTWHCRDYVKKVLIESGVQADPGVILNSHIAASREIQVISYLANDYKHAGVDKSQRWGTDIAPRFGKPFVRGVLECFPYYMKPIVLLWGDSIPEFEFVGAAGVDGLVFGFKDFTWTFSCNIEDKEGKPIGHASAMCEAAFGIWTKILRDHGVVMESAGDA